MKLYFFGAARCVSGSCYLLETDKHKILIDCGMFQGPKALKKRNYEKFPFDINTIDAVFLTHAHIDHSGLIPKLYRSGYRKPIYATKATADLCTIMLPDSGHIQEMEVERKNRKALRSGGPLLDPIYTYDDGVKCSTLFKECVYEQPEEIFEDITVTFKDAGHIMGSAIIEVVVKGKEKTKIVFSGDLGRTGQNIINDPKYIKETDYLLVETTYGNRLHNETKNRKQKLAEIIKKTFAKGGNVIIPAFAVERTQDLLYDLNELISVGAIKEGTIYIDSPLAIAATEVFSRHPEAFDKETQDFFTKEGFLPFLPKNLKYSRTADDSRALNEIKSGTIVISANGMAEAGRIRHHLRHNLWRRESSVIFIGYQANGSLGRRLVEGAKNVKIFNDAIAVNADIYYIDAYSGHADYNDAMTWLQNFTAPPKKTFLVHGEGEASGSFAKLVEEKLGWNIAIPDLMDYYDFAKDELVKSPEVIFYEDKSDEIKYAFDKIGVSLERIQALAKKALNRKLNLDQYSTVNSELANIRKYLNKIKKG